MHKKQWLLILIFLFSRNVSFAQSVNWNKTSNWKLYNIHKQAGFRYTLDTLQNFAHINLSMDTMHSFLKDVIAWPPEKNSVWMGLYVATCETEDKVPRKIIISTYAGFFYDSSTKRYYQVESEVIDKWLEFINESSRRIKVVE